MANSIVEGVPHRQSFAQKKVIAPNPWSELNVTSANGDAASKTFGLRFLLLGITGLMPAFVGNAIEVILKSL